VVLLWMWMGRRSWVAIDGLDWTKTVEEERDPYHARSSMHAKIDERLAKVPASANYACMLFTTSQQPLRISILGRLASVHAGSMLSCRMRMRMRMQNAELCKFRIDSNSRPLIPHSERMSIPAFVPSSIHSSSLPSRSDEV